MILQSPTISGSLEISGSLTVNGAAGGGGGGADANLGIYGLVGLEQEYYAITTTST